MFPELVRLPILDESLPAYFTLLVVGFALATFSAARATKRWGLDREVMIDLGLHALIAGVIGARLLHVIADGYFLDYVNLCVDPAKVVWRVTHARCVSEGFGGVWDATAGECHPAERDCFAWAAFWRGGLTYYGGFIVASVYAWWFMHRERFPFFKAADAAGFAVPLGLFFGRLGCFLGGCCFGSEHHGWLAVVFPPGSAASEAQFRAGQLEHEMLASLPVHPTQLYEAIACLGVAAIAIFVVTPRKRFDGQVFLSFVILYALARFVVEMLRADDRGGLLMLSTSQLLSLAAAAGAIPLWVLLTRRTKRLLAATAAAPSSTRAPS